MRIVAEPSEIFIFYIPFNHHIHMLKVSYVLHFVQEETMPLCMDI